MHEAKRGEHCAQAVRLGEYSSSVQTCEGSRVIDGRVIMAALHTSFARPTVSPARKLRPLQGTSRCCSTQPARTPGYCKVVRCRRGPRHYRPLVHGIASTRTRLLSSAFPFPTSTLSARLVRVALPDHHPARATSRADASNFSRRHRSRDFQRSCRRRNNDRILRLWVGS